MAHQIVWLDAAICDLEAIGEYIAEDSVVYASGVVTRIVSEAALLDEFPRMGRQVPEWDDESIRERIVYNYRLIYRIRQDDVLILAIVHGARLLPEDVRHRSE